MHKVLCASAAERLHEFAETADEIKETYEPKVHQAALDETDTVVAY